MLDWKAKDIFHAYLAELHETGKAISLSQEARTSILKYLNWTSLKLDNDANRLVLDALKAIPNIKTPVVARAIFVCVHAGFEQFIRDLLEAAATTISESKLLRNTMGSANKEILEKLYGHQIKLAGEGFRRYFDPLAHLRIDYAKVANAVVQSSQSDKPFLLDGTVFGIRVGNINREAIDSSFERFGCKISWSGFAENPVLQGILKTSGKRNTEKAVTIFLNEILVKRNQIAHTQGSLVLSMEQLEQQIKFLIELSTFLHQTLSISISNLLPKKQK